MVEAVRDLRQEVADLVRAARAASSAVASCDAETRTRALRAMAEELRRSRAAILEANRVDIEEATSAGLGQAVIERLRLETGRFDRALKLVEEVADMPDLLGRVERRTRAPNGLDVARMRIPLGVVAMIYESRPNVTVEVAASCLRSGNAAILRGGSESFRSNRAYAEAIGTALESVGLPRATIQVVPWTERVVVEYLLEHDEGIDVIIPRGGEGLIRFVCEHSRIPVLKHYKGVCHVYVHSGADRSMALDICVNSKERPFTCHAAETFLIDRAVAEDVLPELCRRLADLKVEIRGDEDVQRIGGADLVKPAEETDWYTEYLDFVISIRVVDGLAAAVEHIDKYGSLHTESIVTSDEGAAQEFLRKVNSSTVFVNASTRLAELPDFGLGPDLGTSTTKLHAYGCMGVEDLTTTKFVIQGTGQLKR